MLRNLSTSLFKSDKERVRTTLAKAKELRPFVERLITVSKKDTLHARRQILRHVHDPQAVARLFDTLSARYAERPGGYTRILKLGPRRGDNAEMAFLELVDAAPQTAASEPEPKKKAASRKKAASGEAAAEAATDKPKRKTAAKKTAAKASAPKKTAAKASTKSATPKKTAARKSAGRKTGE